MPLINSLRERWTRILHPLRVSRERLYDAADRMRQRFGNRQTNPSWFAAVLCHFTDGCRALWTRLTLPYRRLRDRAGSRLDDLRGFSMPKTGIAGKPRLAEQGWDAFLLAVLHYSQTRQRRDLVRGIPALLALVAVLCVALLVSGLRPSVTRDTKLLQYAQAAMSNKDYPKALIAYERMLQVGHADPLTRLSLAQCLFAMGDNQRATQLLVALAPDDALGYIPAHRVRALLIMQAPNASPADFQLARRHLERVLAFHPEDDEAHGLMGTLLLRQEDIRGARDQFAQGADKQPEMALNAAVLSNQLGDAQGVATYASLAVADFQGQLTKAGRAAPVPTVLSLANALCLQKKYGEAVATLENFINRTERDRIVRTILDICDTWQTALDQRNGPDDLDRLRIVKTVLTYQPQNYPWQLRLLDLASEQSLVRPAAIKYMEQLAQDKNAGTEIYFFLGMEAYRREDFQAARGLLEQSYTLMPTHPATANNLACALLKGPNPDPQRALKLATQAVEIAPVNANYHETRGEAFIALEQWSAAVVELERALPGLGNRRLTHEQLAMAYEKLGQSDKAQQHQRLALNDQPN